MIVNGEEHKAMLIFLENRLTYLLTYEYRRSVHYFCVILLLEYNIFPLLLL